MIHKQRRCFLILAAITFVALFSVSSAYRAEVNDKLMTAMEESKTEAAAEENDVPSPEESHFQPNEVPASDNGGADPFAQEVLMARFESWMQEFDKTYGSDEERQKRFETWKSNDAKIRKHNEQVPPPSYTMGQNQFSDMTPEEFQSMHTTNLGNRA